MTATASTAQAVFNVRAFGATGRKADSAQTASQAAIDAAAAAGGGTVYFPPGDYTTGTLRLKSHVRIFLEAGATIWSSKNPADFDKALFFADGQHHIGLDGFGTIDGQAEYAWRLKDEWTDYNIYANQLIAEEVGIPLTRSFPTPDSVGHLVLFLHCADVRIERLRFLHSPSWSMHLYDCERVVIDGVYIYTSQRDGVWADGIDPDGCRDVHINNCTIETGDDAIVFYSYTIYGPALPCENITITNCRLSSSSSAIKFCDCNFNAIRNVVIKDCVITNSNRGIAFMVFDGGVVENVTISNVTIQTRRFDWFWWGDADPLHFNLIQRSEMHLNWDKDKDRPVGAIRNVTLANLIAAGPGPSLIHGSRQSPLENITFDNVRLTVDADPDSPWQKAPVALTVENARNFTLRDFEIGWTTPSQPHLTSALLIENAQGLTLEGVSAGPAPANLGAPAIVLRDVAGAVVADCRANPSSGAFLHLEGSTQNVLLRGNDTRKAAQAVTRASGVAETAVRGV
ncbi:MAG: right-handed parallel beta-helix repeat-containing protein [Anaerolineales bacterium]|nr:right-handed parallel beta-helix repeat-containing protein [Anaerolineales bacterium]